MGITRPKDELKEKEREKKEVAKSAKVEKPKELKVIVRVAGTDLDGEKPLAHALMKIKGISHSMSKAICSVSGFNPNIIVGSLGEKDLEKLEEVIKDPVKFGVPGYVVNRRKDLETGRDMHLVGSDLDIAKKFDIQKMIDMKTNKGIKHMYGLPVRGQRTRSSFRKGRAVGVIRKAIKITKKEEKK